MTKLDFKTLDSFNEKVNSIKEFSFIKDSKFSGASIKSEKITTGDNVGKYRMTSTRFGAHGESVDAFLLNYRFFIQNNEKISVGNLFSIYESGNIPLSFRDKFIEIRSEINDIMKIKCLVKIDGKYITYDDIHEAFIYGKYAHENMGQKSKIEYWETLPIFNFIEQEFHSIILRRYALFKEIVELNNDLMKHFKENAKESEGI